MMVGIMVHQGDNLQKTHLCEVESISNKRKMFNYAMFFALAIIAVIAVSGMVLYSDDSDAYSELSPSARTGWIGNGLKWTYDDVTDSLTIAGTGETYDYFINEGYFGSSWRHANPVDKVTISGSNITLCAHVFKYFRCNEMIIGEGVVSIEAWAFNGTKINTVRFPTTLQSVEQNSIRKITAQTVYWNSNADVLPFDGYPYGITNLIFGSNVTTVESQNLKNTVNVTFPLGMTKLIWYDTELSSPLNLVTYPNLEYISLSNISIGTVSLPSSTTYLRLNKTSTTSLDCGNANLKTLILTDLSSLTAINLGMTDFTSMDKFDIGNVSVQSVSVSPSNPYSTVLDGVLYSKSMDTLYYYPGGKTDASFTVPDGVKEIWDVWNNHMKSFIINKDVEKCGRIQGSSLQCLNIPSNLTEGVLGGSYGSLKVVVIPTQYQLKMTFNCAVVKYYSKYIESVTASVVGDDIKLTVTNVPGCDYKFRIGTEYNESNVVAPSSGTVTLPENIQIYPKVYVSIESGENEDSHEWFPPEPNPWVDRLKYGGSLLVIIAVIGTIGGFFIGIPVYKVGVPAAIVGFILVMLVV